MANYLSFHQTLRQAFCMIWVFCTNLRKPSSVLFLGSVCSTRLTANFREFTRTAHPPVHKCCAEYICLAPKRH